MTFPTRFAIVAAVVVSIQAACRETSGPIDETPVPTKLDLGILWWPISGTSDGGFVALDDQGISRYTRDANRIWSVPHFGLGQCPTDPPCVTAVDDQGDVYVPLYDGLVALTASGQERWRALQVTGGVLAVGSGNLMYATTRPGAFLPNLLFALNKTNGQIVWQLTGAATFLLLDEARKALYGIRGSILLALDPLTGEEKWRASLPSNGRYAALGSNGTIYVVCNTSLVAVTPSGSAIQTASLGSEANVFSPVIDDDGTVVVAHGRSVTAFKPDGSIKWDYTHQYVLAPTSPAIDAAHNVYVVLFTGNGYTLVQIKNGQLNREIYPINDPHGRAVLIAKDGRVFFNAHGSIIYFDTKGTNQAVWSQMGGGPGRTERR